MTALPDPTDGIRKLAASVVIAAIRDLDRELAVWEQRHTLNNHQVIRHRIEEHLDFLMCRGRSQRIGLFWLGANDIPPLTAQQIGKLLQLERRNLLVLEDGL